MCKINYDDDESETSITYLSQVELSSSLAWIFLDTIGISHIPRCWGNLVSMVTTMKPQ